MKNSEEPALPTKEEFDSVVYNYMGLTKREYFAGLAMQGLLSNSAWMKEFEGGEYIMPADVVSELSTRMADQLLKELEKPIKNEIH